MASPPKDFVALLAAFADHGVKAIIVGGYAFAFHAAPRLTKDIELLVEPTPDNAKRVVAALEDFIGDLGLSPEDFSEPGQIVQIGYPPLRVDVITSIEGVGFAEAWAARVQGRFGEAPAAYLSRDHLIANKRAVGRTRDLLDVEALEAIADA